MQRVLESANLQEMIDKLAKIPLLYQPGTQWVYSVSVDIQGYLVEKLSGKPLGEFMRENIWQPLGMKDTAFHVAPEKIGRFATLYAANPAGASGRLRRRQRRDGLHQRAHHAIRRRRPGFHRRRLPAIRADAAQRRRTRRISHPGAVVGGADAHQPVPPALMNSREFGIGFFHINPGFGFGFDFGVYTDPGFISHPWARAPTPGAAPRARGSGSIPQTISCSSA